MKTILRWCLLGLCIASGSAYAMVEEIDVNRVLLQVDNGILIGAKGVPVGGSHFDVQFIDGTCVALFSGCDELEDFPFSTVAGALRAASALLSSVFIDVPSHPFDTDPSLTSGCPDLFHCDINIPYTLTNSHNFQDADGNPADGESAAYVNDALDGADSLGVQGLFVNKDGSTLPQQVYAIWAPSAIPEPGTAACLGLGLLALMLLQRRGTLPRGTVVRRSAMAYMVAALGVAGSASATLLDRGPDLVYDNVLNITWTRNGSLPGSSRLTWDQANAWAANLVFAGFDDWRLPYGSVSAGAGPTATSVFCQTATEPACRDNEMAYMFFHDLGGTGAEGEDKTGTQTALGGQQLTGIQGQDWSGTAFDSDNAWGFMFNTFPSTLRGDKDIALNAWAVRAGDVGAIPEPATVLLIGVGMLGLVWTRRSRRRRSFGDSNNSTNNYSRMVPRRFYAHGSSITGFGKIN